MSKDFRFVTSSVNADEFGIIEMLLTAVATTLEELRKHCHTAQIEQHLGYSAAFPMNNDKKVEYYKSHYLGAPCYFIDHTGTEYVFVKEP